MNVEPGRSGRVAVWRTIAILAALIACSAFERLAHVGGRTISALQLSQAGLGPLQIGKVFATTSLLGATVPLAAGAIAIFAGPGATLTIGACVCALTYVAGAMGV